RQVNSNLLSRSPKSKPNLSSVRAGRLLESVPMAAKLTIGFLGAGKMATALAKGFLRAGLVSPKDVIASDVSPAARDAFSKETSARIAQNNAEVAKSAPILVLAVKPN